MAKVSMKRQITLPAELCSIADIHALFAEPADFPDALIINKAKRHAQLYKLNLTNVFTFDKAAQEIEGMIDPQYS